MYLPGSPTGGSGKAEIASMSASAVVIGGSAFICGGTLGSFMRLSCMAL